MPKVRSTLIWRILLLVICTVLLAALLSAIVFSKVGAEGFVSIKSDEMLARTKYIADITSMYLQGRMGGNEYSRTLGRDTDIWDASIYGYNKDGELFLYPNYTDSTESRELTSKYLNEVLGGKEAVDIKGLVIGIPVRSDFGNIIGAVFMVKPLSEVYDTLNSISNAIIISLLAVVVIMLIPVYIAAQSIARPIRRMTMIASGMASGKFDVLADEKGKGELASLGRSLNDLSNNLFRTINDLTFERNQLKSIIDGMSDALIVIDVNGEVVHNNPAAVGLLGGTDGKILNDSQVLARIVSEISSITGDENVTRKVFDYSHIESVLRVSIDTLNATDIDDTQYLVLIRDTTEAYRYEQARKDYVANVSHELRTPIASIRGLADALNDGLIQSDTDKNRYYGYILKETMRLSRLIDDLLELSRLQSATTAFQKKKTDVEEIVMGTADRFIRAAKDSGRNIITDVDINLANTNGDRAEQVLIILIDNAISHSEHGDILVSAKRDEKLGKIVISVRNEGEIDEIDISHLFERFYKVDKSHSGKGTGLGLSIAAEVCELLGERIWATSEGGFVTFSFTLDNWITE